MACAKPGKTEKAKRQKVAHGVELKPIDYQPSTAELEADATLPASFDRMPDASFAGDRNTVESK